MTQVNIAQARFNMIEQQIRPWEVLDPRVLEVLAVVPREDFVAEAQRELAFADLELPLGHGETMLAPKMAGRILQAVGVRAGDKVLEVGTGSGFLTACLAKFGARVVSVEREEEFTATAKARLEAHGLGDVALETGDATLGWPAAAPYDVIVLTGSLPELPQPLLDQLKIGGRLFAVVGRGPVMEALLVTRVGEQGYSRRSLFDTVLPPLTQAAPGNRFVF